MAALNEKIRRAIRSDSDAETAFERLLESRCDERLLLERVAWVASACGMVSYLKDRRRKEASLWPSDVLPIPRNTLADTPKQLFKLAELVEKLNRSAISPVLFAKPMSEPASVEPNIYSTFFRPAAEFGDALPGILRVYAVALAGATRIAREFSMTWYKRIAEDAEKLLIDYVKESAGTPQFSSVNTVLRVGCEALGRLAPPKNRYGDVNAGALKERYRAAKRRTIPTLPIPR